jgi:hypothetical protein
MDPATIVGLVASCMTICVKAGKLSRDLKDLRTRFKNVEHAITIVSAQVAAISASTSRLSYWLESSSSSHEYGRIVSEFTPVLESCDALLALVQEHVTNVKGTSDSLIFRSRLKHMWNESTLQRYREDLGSQVQALSLMIQCIRLYVNHLIFEKNFL